MNGVKQKGLCGMNHRKRLSIICLYSLLMAFAWPARAHQPFCEFADLTAAAPWQVPNASISYAYFGNVFPAGDIDYFRFDAEAGQQVLLSLSIPAIPDMEVFAPVMAVFGPGVDVGEPPQLPMRLVKPAEPAAMMIPLGNEAAYWYEPFGRRYFWNWDNYFFKSPATATYTVALWHPANEIGRYSFVIGQREVFGGDADCFSTYDEYWTPLEPGVNPYRDTALTDDMMMRMSGTMHDHNALFEMDSASAPTVDLTLIPLMDGSYNIQVMTGNFTFTPALVDQAPVAGEGHAHLYIDGVKVARLYGEWHHLPSLPEAAEAVSVTLYANDHSAFAVDGSPVSASVSVADALASA